MQKIEEKLKKCIEEGKRGERHKGLREINPDKQLALEYLNKAMHNLKAITFFYNGGFSDWSASAAFYSLYHCLLAILAKNGYESRNQSCTFAIIEDLIKNNKITEITIEELKDIFDSDIKENLEHSSKILDIRESMQYSTKISIETDTFKKLKEKTIILFEKLRREIEKD
ncbi:MAG: HEPN domain-containing protein [Nanoarchaeota archaeon]|nr:HEPN domain-containing protein [Nanoarchaeota archaeon]MBU0962997.1 HEPN domain-containing protein [Nanoarchaeota archaeon]